MALTANTYNFSGGFNLKAEQPIDARMRVSTEAELTASTTWTADYPSYDGMMVAIIETGDIWVLKDKTKYTDITTGAGWVKSGGSELSGGTNIEITDGTINALGYTYDSIKNSFSEATGNTAVGKDSHAEGRKTYAIGDQSHVEGVGGVANISAKFSWDEGATALIADNETNELTIGDVVKWGDEYRRVTSVNGVNIGIDTPFSTSGESQTITKVRGISYGQYSHSEGASSRATGGQSHAEGNNTKAYGSNSHTEGYATSALGSSSHAEGGETIAGGPYSHTEGYKSTVVSAGDSYTENTLTASTTTSNGFYAHAEGNASLAQGHSSHAEGKKTFAKGAESHAEGYKTKTNGEASHAEGYSTTASGNYGSHAEGYDTIADGNASHAEGNGTQTQNIAEHAEGRFNVSHKGEDKYGSSANTQHSIGIGLSAESRTNAVEVMQNGDLYVKGVGGYNGINTKVQTATTKTVKDVVDDVYTKLQDLQEEKQDVLTAGSNIKIEDDVISAIGYTYDNTKNSFAEGTGSTATGTASHAEGSGTTASADYSHAEGNKTKATGYGSHAEGFRSEATNENYSENTLTESTRTESGYYAHAEGNATIAQGCNSHAEGKKTFAKGDISHAEGDHTVASGSCSHTEGSGTTASGNYGSHAEGYNTKAIGDTSHAQGSGTVVVGNYGSHAEGLGKVTNITGFTWNNSSLVLTASTTGHVLYIGNIISQNDEYRKVTNVNEKNITIDKAFSNSGSKSTIKLVQGITYGSESHSEGLNTTASGDYGSHTEGNKTIANGTTSHAEGNNTKANGNDSHAEGVYVTAVGGGSHAEGNSTTASGSYSHSEGQGSETNITNIKFGWNNSTVISATTGTIDSQIVPGEILRWGNEYRRVLSVDPATNTFKLYSTKFSSTNETEQSLVRVKGISFGTASHSEGANVIASGSKSHAEGTTTLAAGDSSHAEGLSTKAFGSYSHAEGSSTIANYSSTHAEGVGSSSQVHGTFKIGNTTVITASTTDHGLKKGDIIEWKNTYRAVDDIDTNNALYITINDKFGVSVETAGQTINKVKGIAFSASSHAEGEKTVAIGTASHAEGYNTNAYKKYSHAEGCDTFSDGIASHAEGSGTTASADYSHAEGNKTKATGYGSHAEGFRSEATNENYSENTLTESTATTRGYYTHAEGNATIAQGYNSHAEGKKTFAKGNISHAEGRDSNAIGDISHAEGGETNAGGAFSHTEGYRSTVVSAGDSYTENTLTAGTRTDNGFYAHAEGNASLAQGHSSHAEGKKTFAKGGVSHAEGVSTTAIGEASHTEGQQTIAKSMRSHAEGLATVAYGNQGHAEGYGTGLTLSGTYSWSSGSTSISGDSDANTSSIAVGDVLDMDGAYRFVTNKNDSNRTLVVNTGMTTTRSGVIVTQIKGAANFCAHSEGQWCNANGSYSHAEGYETRTINSQEHAEGKYNVSHTNSKDSGCTIHSIGIGSSSSRKNAVEVMQNGDVYIKGIGGYDGVNTKAQTATTKTLQEVISNNSLSAGTNITISNGIVRAIGYYFNDELSSFSAGSGANVDNAKGIFSFAAGHATEAHGYASCAIGQAVTASGASSSAFGYHTVAENDYETVVGTYNKTGVTDALFVVGNGNSDIGGTKNALTVHSGGTDSVQGTVNGVLDVYLGCPIGTIVMWGGEGTNPPEGWLSCDGSSIAVEKVTTGNDYDFTFSGVKYRATIERFRNLVKTVSTRFGYSGSSSNIVGILLPNFDERFPMGSWADVSVPIYGGESSVTLSKEQMPSHSHRLLQGGASSDPDDGVSFTDNNIGYKYTGASSSANPKPIVEETGGGKPHNNLPPYVRISFIIKYL